MFFPHSHTLGDIKKQKKQIVLEAKDIIFFTLLHFWQ